MSKNNDTFRPLHKSFKRKEPRQVRWNVSIYRRQQQDWMAGGAEAYTFLDTAAYMKHEGIRPMDVLRKLDCPIPVKFLKKTKPIGSGVSGEGKHSTFLHSQMTEDTHNE